MFRRRFIRQEAVIYLPDHSRVGLSCSKIDNTKPDYLTARIHADLTILVPCEMEAIL